MKLLKLSAAIGLLLSLLVIVGIFSNESRTQHSNSPTPSVIMQVLDPSLEMYSVMWQHEIGRRFPNAVGILVHGGNFESDRWIVEGNYASGNHVQLATEVVRYYQTLYPGRVIVLCACNPGHLPLGIPNVYYFKNSVWCVPDREITPEMFGSAEIRRTIDGKIQIIPGTAPLELSRWVQDPEINGNIFEAVSE